MAHASGAKVAPGGFSDSKAPECTDRPMGRATAEIQRTITTPVMPACTRQKSSTWPGFKKRCENCPSAPKNGESNEPSTALTVCATPSSFLQVTVVPATTSMGDSKVERRISVSRTPGGGVLGRGVGVGVVVGVALGVAVGVRVGVGVVVARAASMVGVALASMRAGEVGVGVGLAVMVGVEVAGGAESPHAASKVTARVREASTMRMPARVSGGR